ncbi:MAG: hypothetical protein WA754_15360, partial [Pseudolabrys sp.]
ALKFVDFADAASGATHYFAIIQLSKRGNLHVHAKIRIAVVLANLHRWHRWAMARLTTSGRPHPVRLDLCHEWVA